MVTLYNWCVATRTMPLRGPAGRYWSQWRATRAVSNCCLWSEGIPDTGKFIWQIVDWLPHRDRLADDGSRRRRMIAYQCGYECPRNLSTSRDLEIYGNVSYYYLRNVCFAVSLVSTIPCCHINYSCRMDLLFYLSKYMMIYISLTPALMIRTRGLQRSDQKRSRPRQSWPLVV